MAKLSLKKFLGMRTIGDPKDIPQDGCFEAKNIVHLPKRFATRAGCFRSTNEYAGAINLIYQFNRIAGDPIILISYDGKIEKILYPTFIGVPTSGVKPLTVHFFDFTLDWNGDITAWKWDFGDGNTSTDQHPLNEYADVGTYSVKLTVYAGTREFYKVRQDYITVREEENGNGDGDGDGTPPTPTPIVTSVDPDNVDEGYSATALDIAGKYFFKERFKALIFVKEGDAQLFHYRAFEHRFITITSSILIDATLQEGLSAGSYDVLVVNNDGRYGILEDGFEVNEMTNNIIFTQ